MCFLNQVHTKTFKLHGSDSSENLQNSFEQGSWWLRGEDECSLGAAVARSGLVMSLHFAPVTSAGHIAPTVVISGWLSQGGVCVCVSVTVCVHCGSECLTGFMTCHSLPSGLHMHAHWAPKWNIHKHTHTQYSIDLRAARPYSCYSIYDRPTLLKV